MSDRIYRGRDRRPNPAGESTTYRQETLHLGWKARDELDLELLVPRVEIHNEARGRKAVDLEGLGDISLIVDWGPWRCPAAAGEEPGLLDRRGLSFVAGLKLPTGEENDAVAPGVTPPSLLQLGTGTYDPLVGWRYRAGSGDLSIFHATLAQVSGGAGDAGLRPGGVLQTSTGVAYALSGRVTPSLVVEGVFRGKDALDGHRIGNTGSSFWFATPGVSVRITDRLSLEASVRIPVYRNVDRAQLVPGNLWTVGVSWSF